MIGTELRRGVKASHLPIREVPPGHALCKRCGIVRKTNYNRRRGPVNPLCGDCRDVVEPGWRGKRRPQNTA